MSFTRPGHIESTVFPWNLDGPHREPDYSDAVHAFGDGNEAEIEPYCRCCLHAHSECECPDAS